jgi:hypothetical protein
MEWDIGMLRPCDAQHPLIEVEPFDREGPAQVGNMAAGAASHIQDRVPGRCLVGSDDLCKPPRLGFVVLPSIDCIVVLRRIREHESHPFADA